MNSVITEATDKSGGIVFYDADCAFCTTWARRGERILKGRGLVFQPLPMPADEMKVVTATGEILGGAVAVVYLARRIWWAWPLWVLSRAPAIMKLLSFGYRWFAERRYCTGGTCQILKQNTDNSSAKISDWAPLACALIVAFVGGRVLPAWAWMWSLAVVLYFGFKWITWIRARRRGLRISMVRGIGYWLLWPGMSPMAFVISTYRPQPKEWAGAFANTALGAILIWLVARQVPVGNNLLAGWIGWIGLGLLLHFGVMRFAALAWRVEPIMRIPILADSLHDFWSARWNTAFRDLAHALWFEPIRRRCGVGAATLGVFLLSGAVHELVISLPAGAGYGLPTLYFTLQGLGMLVERKWRRFFCRRLVTWIVVAGPAFWLFPPSFMNRVVVPFLCVIGALN